MKNVLPRFFEGASAETLREIMANSEVKAAGVFAETPLLEMSPHKKLMLIGSHLVLCEDHSSHNPQRIARLTFETKFEMLRGDSGRKDSTQEDGSPRNYQGIRLERDGSEAIHLYSSSQESLLEWRSVLEKKINQKGFHQLFKPIKKLGKGNFASVYLAERLQDKRLVAVKAFSKEACFNQDKGKESLINEISLMRRMNHPNIMKLHGVFESQNSIYMTLELLDGTQLYNKIQSKHKFSLQETRTVMQSILSGIEHMDAHRIMHRDLKPENLMFKSKDSLEVVIVDFGLATWADEAEYLFVRCGTPGYVAPEIINLKNMKQKCDPVCDMFSAGLIFHILLMGRSVFPGRSYNEVLSQNKACSFDLNNKEYHDLDPIAHHLLTRMLDKNPDTRIRASEVLKHNFFAKSAMEEELMKINIDDSNQMLMSTPLLRNKLNMQNVQTPQLMHKPSFDTQFVQRKVSGNKENVQRSYSPRGYQRTPVGLFRECN